MSQTRAQLLKGFSNTSAPDDAITVDSSGRVGIGTSSASSYNASADNLVVAGTGDTGVTVASGSSSQGSLFFADGTSGSAVAEGYLIYVHSSNYMALGTANTERLRILSDGTIRLASNCPGIDFSQIQTNASGMTSETLDHYEEGTFDAFATVAGSFTGETTRTSRYTRIGNLVYIDLRVQWTGTSGATGLVFDLPFTQAGTTGPASGHTGLVFYQGTSVDASAISAHVAKGSSQVAFYHTDGGSSFVSVQTGNVNGAYDWIVSFSYFAA